MNRRPPTEQNICGPVVKRLREEHGFTQTELARRLRPLGWATTQRHIKAIEEGTCRVLLYQVKIFSELFAVPISTMFGEDEPDCGNGREGE